MIRRHAAQVAAALVLDAALGEPPEPVHPTVLMGRAVSAFENGAAGIKSPGSRRLAGLAVALSLPTLVFFATRKLLCLVPGGLRWMVGTTLISTTLSMHGLAEAAGSVERGLREGRLERAREHVGQFVGRDTDELSKSEVCRAAVESVAENSSDGVVAPMVYGLLFGAPGALAYKAVNTLDSMVGHPEPPYTELGWASARLDDLVNLVPSRITVLLVAVASGRPFRTLGITHRYGPLTASPNAGMTEAAFAGALGVSLGGTNSYDRVPRPGPKLGEGRAPAPDDLRRAVSLMRRSFVLLGVLALLQRIPARG
jgi:adenosylcobinamide-phosphate synthase